MKVKQFVEDYEIKAEDLRKTFKLSKKLEIDSFRHKGCFNCGNIGNQHSLPSEPWTRVQYCWICNHLNLVIESDRMGGTYTDTIECYTDSGT